MTIATEEIKRKNTVDGQNKDARKILAIPRTPFLQLRGDMNTMHAKIYKEHPHVFTQVRRALGLKQDVLDQIDQALSVIPPGTGCLESFLALRQITAFSARSFDVIFKSSHPDQVDRATSMLSGPFFTSEEFPIPISDAGMNYPVVQLDLREASALAKQPIGDGLLQLWYDPCALEGIVRVIPRDKVKSGCLTDFGFENPLGYGGAPFDGFPLPNWWVSQPATGPVSIIHAYRPSLFQCQDGYLDVFMDDLAAELSQNLIDKVNQFDRAARYRSFREMSMLGTFYPIQYSAADIGANCLFSISDWGASGGAEVFYEITGTGDTKFSFAQCMR